MGLLTMIKRVLRRKRPKSIAQLTAEKYYGAKGARALHKRLRHGQTVHLRTTWTARATLRWGGDWADGNDKYHCWLSGPTVQHMEARRGDLPLNDSEFLWACLAACATQNIDDIIDYAGCVSFWSDKDSRIYKASKRKKGKEKR